MVILLDLLKFHDRIYRLIFFSFDPLQLIQFFSLSFFIEIKDTKIPIEKIRNNRNAILVLTTDYSNKTQIYRKIRVTLDKENILNPVILKYNYQIEDEEKSTE